MRFKWKPVCSSQCCRQSPAAGVVRPILLYVLLLLLFLARTASEPRRGPKRGVVASNCLTHAGRHVNTRSGVRGSVNLISDRQSTNRDTLGAIRRYERGNDWGILVGSLHVTPEHDTLSQSKYYTGSETPRYVTKELLLCQHDGAPYQLLTFHLHDNIL